jgi:o-succinylbenzoate synthase
MKVKFEVIPHVLKFRFKAGTSRGAFTEKETWFIKAYSLDKPNAIGWGEASPLKGLSLDYSEDYQTHLNLILEQFSKVEIPTEANEVLAFIAKTVPSNYPSIRFGIETALLDLIHGGNKVIFKTDFVRGKYRLPINGLIWMGSEDFMQQQIEEKLKEGFSTIKLKIGALDFNKELDLLEGIRKHYSSREITLRVDANGAFNEVDVFVKLEQLASLDIHSIEQPIMAGQQLLMKSICDESPMDIALDEELIGINSLDEKRLLLSQIRPQYIILKPSLLGGILACKEWIALAESMNIGWWMTSMLESNIALNAIAQFTSQYLPTLPQGLGTGKLYHNNIESPLEIRRGELLYNFAQDWDQI